MMNIWDAIPFPVVGPNQMEELCGAACKRHIRHRTAVTLPAGWDITDATSAQLAFDTNHLQLHEEPVLVYNAMVKLPNSSMYTLLQHRPVPLNKVCLSGRLPFIVSVSPLAASDETGPPSYTEECIEVNAVILFACFFNPLCTNVTYHLLLKKLEVDKCSICRDVNGGTVIYIDIEWEIIPSLITICR